MWVQVPEEERQEMSMQMQFMGAVRAVGMSVHVHAEAIDRQCTFHCKFLVQALETCRAYEF